jgi:hypothetical protein
MQRNPYIEVSDTTMLKGINQLASKETGIYIDQIVIPF